ncbi:hypothetical protein EVA_16108 [gut metagenome]|uniref:Uncharacterized protein n=1 Tax=gut metagenome TaxID=749906 RepID=J9C7F6_9ZZZZ
MFSLWLGLALQQFKVRWQKSANNKASASIVQTGADALL